MSNTHKGSIEFSMARTLGLAIPLLILAALVVQVTDVFLPAPTNDLSLFQDRLQGRVSYVPTVPSPIVYGIFVPVLLLVAAIPSLRRRWPVTRAELVVVFCMLFLAVPIFGAGFWHQFVSLQLTQLQWDAPQLWPNRGNLLKSASVEDEPAAAARWTIDPAAELTQSPGGTGRCLKIVHDSDQDTATITLELTATGSGQFVTAGRHYWIFGRVRLDEASLESKVQLLAGVDLADLKRIGRIVAATPATVQSPYRFRTLGPSSYQVPRELDDRFYVRLQFEGKGTVYVKQFAIFETEDVASRYLEGYKEVTPEVYAALSEMDRAGVWERPDGFWARLRYELIGRVPWGSWARPLAVWSLLVLGTFLALFCLVTIFYRQWEDGDGMTFPLQAFIIDLTRTGEGGRLWLLRCPPFWVGAGGCFLLLSLQELNAQFPDLPTIRLQLAVADLLPTGPLKEAASFARGLLIDVRPAYVAVAFLMSLEMSLSLVVFFLAGLIYRMIAFFTPLRTLHLGAGHYGAGDFPFDQLLMIGSLMFLAVYCLWAARKHLAKVLRKVFLGAATVDDANEAIGYRWATIGLVGSVAMIVCFALVAQLNVVFVTVWVLVLLLMALSAARIRAETGLPHLSLFPVNPQVLVVSVGGAMVFGHQQVLFACRAAFLYAGAFLMIAPILAESMAVATRVGVPMRKLGRCMLLSFVLAVGLGGIVYMSWAYTWGARNMNSAATDVHRQYRTTNYNLGKDNLLITEYFRDHPEEPQILTPQRRKRISMNLPGIWVFTGVSFVITALLSVIRVIWLGFPLHPLGFALAFTPAVYALWPSIAVGHLIKRFGLRFGGMPLIRRVLRPFMVGLFVSDLVTVVIWRILGSLLMG